MVGVTASTPIAIESTSESVKPCSRRRRPRERKARTLAHRCVEECSHPLRCQLASPARHYFRLGAKRNCVAGKGNVMPVATSMRSSVLDERAMIQLPSDDQLIGLEL